LLMLTMLCVWNSPFRFTHHGRAVLTLRWLVRSKRRERRCRLKVPPALQVELGEVVVSAGGVGVLEGTAMGAWRG